MSGRLLGRRTYASARAKGSVSLEVVESTDSLRPSSLGRSVPDDSASGETPSSWVLSGKSRRLESPMAFESLPSLSRLWCRSDLGIDGQYFFIKSW